MLWLNGAINLDAFFKAVLYFLGRFLSLNINFWYLLPIWLQLLVQQTRLIITTSWIMVLERNEYIVSLVGIFFIWLVLELQFNFFLKLLVIEFVIRGYLGWSASKLWLWFVLIFKKLGHAICTTNLLLLIMILYAV